MAFQTLVESVVKLGLAPVLVLYMVWYFTRQFDRLVSANERMSRAVDRIAIHLDLPVEQEEPAPKRARRRNMVFGGSKSES